MMTIFHLDGQLSCVLSCCKSREDIYNITCQSNSFGSLTLFHFRLMKLLLAADFLSNHKTHKHTAVSQPLHYPPKHTYTHSHWLHCIVSGRVFICCSIMVLLTIWQPFGANAWCFFRYGVEDHAECHVQQSTENVTWQCDNDTHVCLNHRPPWNLVELLQSWK